MLWAVLAAVCFGVASVVQQLGARRAPLNREVGLRLARQLGSEPLFLLGTGLDAAGFVASFAALRVLPVFAVEAVLASAVAVTAVLAWRWLGDALGWSEWAGVGVILFGVSLIALSARPSRPVGVGPVVRVVLLAGVPVVLLAGQAVARRPRGPAAVILGCLSGVAFGGFALAGRVVPPGRLLVSPLSLAAAAYVPVGLVLYGAALQRGSVTALTAAMTGSEALVPAVVGLALGDGARTGYGPVAAAGFGLVLVAVVILTVRGAPSTNAKPPMFSTAR